MINSGLLCWISENTSSGWLSRCAIVPHMINRRSCHPHVVQPAWLPFPHWHRRKLESKQLRMRCWGDFKRPAKGKPLEQITYSVHDWRSSHCKEHKYEYIFQTPQEHKKNRRDRPFEQKPDWGASPISSKHTYHNLARGWERLGIYIWTLWWAPLELLRWIMHNRYNRYR